MLNAPVFYQVGGLTESPDAGGHRFIYDINQSNLFTKKILIKRMNDVNKRIKKCVGEILNKRSYFPSILNVIFILIQYV